MQAVRIGSSTKYVGVAAGILVLIAAANFAVIQIWQYPVAWCAGQWQAIRSGAAWAHGVIVFFGVIYGAYLFYRRKFDALPQCVAIVVLIMLPEWARTIYDPYNQGCWVPAKAAEAQKPEQPAKLSPPPASVAPEKPKVEPKADSKPRLQTLPPRSMEAELKRARELGATKNLYTQEEAADIFGMSVERLADIRRAWGTQESPRWPQGEYPAKEVGRIRILIDNLERTQMRPSAR